MISDATAIDLDFTDDAADDNVVSQPSVSVCAIIENPDVKALCDEMTAASPDVLVHTFSHKEDFATAIETAQVIIMECRLMEGFDDLVTIRGLRERRPLVPIIVLSVNQDPDFVLEALRTGANDYISTAVTAGILAAKLHSFHKLSEAGRLIEIQNSELVRSMKAEREATEKKLQAEKERSLAEAQAEAHRQTREILDNLREGFYVVNKDLVVSKTTSAACAKIFGQEIAGQPLGHCLNLQGNKETEVRLAFEQLFENILPLEVNLGLLPVRTATAEGKIIDFAYTPVVDKQLNPLKVIVAATDVTETVKQQQKLEKQNVLNQTIIEILTNRDAFNDFIGDSRRDLSNLKASTDAAVCKRILHTLKGNAAAFNLVEVANGIHDIETEFGKHLEQHGEVQKAAQKYADTIEGMIRGFIDSNRNVLQISFDGEPKETFTVTDDQISAFRKAAEAAGGAIQLALTSIIDGITLKPVSRLTAVFKPTVERIASRQEKKVTYLASGLDLKLSTERYGSLVKSLIHAIRNSCDHGIEFPDERLAVGKRETGLIKVAFERSGGSNLRVLVLDDGRGISSERLVAAALKNKLISRSDAAKFSSGESLDLIFMDGVSTAERITDTSGRGTGMSCIKSQVEKLGGTIRVVSKANIGTKIEIIVPEK